MKILKEIQPCLYCTKLAEILILSIQYVNITKLSIPNFHDRTPAVKHTNPPTITQEILTEKHNMPLNYFNISKCGKYCL
jgi:hypothetical protein